MNTRPDEHGVWAYHTQSNGDVYGYDFGPNVIMVNGKRVRWGYMLRGDFYPMRDMSEACRQWVYGLTSDEKEHLCEILSAMESKKI